MCHNPLDKVKCRVVYNREISKGIFDMGVDVGEMVKTVKPGQFVNLYVKGGVHLLPRPISICEVNAEEKTIRLVYAVVGKGTKILTTRAKRDSIEVLGALGNGFELEIKSDKVKEVLIVGGGVGTPPLLELSKQLKNLYGDKIKLTIVLGFRDESYLVKDFEKYGDVYVATDSGKTGFKGNVIELIKDTFKDKLINSNNQDTQTDDSLGFECLYACGPTPMLKGLQLLCIDYGIKSQLSLEERMGCGFGACVGCVTPIRRVINDETLKLTKDTMDEEDYDYKKVCKDGPVFDGMEVIF